MATKRTITKNTTANTVEPIDIKKEENLEIESESVESIAETTVIETQVETVVERNYEATDPIKCVSITSGELGMIGIKSGINYRWACRGDVTEVEYQDLVAAIRSGKKHITAPFFIIDDKDFLKKWPQVEKNYASMYSIKDLTDVLKLDAASMKKTILNLPTGARESIKNIASTMITKGQLDSVQKIKVLDEIYDTKFMLMTEIFG